MGRTYSEIDYYVDSKRIGLDLGKTIFWVGAGVSKDSPSNLPLGNALTDVYLNTMLGTKFAQSFIMFWNKHFSPLREVITNGKVGDISNGRSKHDSESVELKDTSDLPRLEYIIGEISKMDNEFADFTFCKEENNSRFGRKKSINALRHIALARPNKNHMLLAECAKAGATIITTNFDVCIEKALGVCEYSLNNPVIHNGIQAIRYGEFDNQCIYHIHGIATDKNIESNLGTTINKISEPLSDAFCKMIEEYLSEGYSIVYLGYSGSDYFDVHTFFEEHLIERDFRGKGIYVDHCVNEEMVREHSSKEKKYAYLLQPFPEQVIYYGVTDAILQDICKSAGLNAEFNIEEDDVKAFEKVKDELKSITDEYDSESQAQDDFYFINMFRIASQLNINPKHFYPGWVEHLGRICKDWEDDAKDTVDRMFAGEGQLNDRIVDDIWFNNWDSKKQEYIRIADKMKSHKHIWEQSHSTELGHHSSYFNLPVSERILKGYVDKTCRILEKGIKDSYDETIERDTMKYLYGKQIKKLFILWEKIPLLRGMCERKLKRLIPYYEQVLNYSFNRFMYRTYYLFSTRFLNIMKVITGDPDTDENGLYGDIQHEWDICMETPDMFDARKTIENRIEQIDMLKKRGVKVDADIRSRFAAVLEELESIRRD